MKASVLCSDLLIPAALAVLVALPTQAQDRPERPARSDEALAVEAEALLIRGLTLKRLGRYEAALEVLRQAQARAPGEGAVSAAIADVYSTLGDNASAVFHARRAFETERRFAYGLQFARTLYVSGDASSAQRVLTDISRTVLTEQQREILERFADDPGELIRDDRAAVPVDSMDAERRFFTGAPSGSVRDSLRMAARRLLDDGRPAEAAILLSDLLREDVRSEDSWRLLARARFESGDSEGAASTIADGLLLFPGSVDLIVTGVRAHLALGEVDEAAALVADVERLLPELSPEDGGKLLVAAGDAASARGDLDSARSLWERALELAPGNSGIHDRLNQ